MALHLSRHQPPLTSRLCMLQTPSLGQVLPMSTMAGLKLPYLSWTSLSKGLQDTQITKTMQHSHG
jgi:hypothetical protein